MKPSGARRRMALNAKLGAAYEVGGVAEAAVGGVERGGGQGPERRAAAVQRAEPADAKGIVKNQM